MKTAFKILPQEAQENPFELLVEVGWDNVSFIYYTNTPLNIRALFAYHIEKNITPQQLAQELASLFAEENLPAHSSVHICYNFKECTFLPSEFYKENSIIDILAGLYGLNSDTECFAEGARGMPMQVAYRIDKRISRAMLQQFPQAVKSHSFSLQIPALRKLNDCMYVIVYQHSIKLLLFKNDQLQLARFFEYTTPSDVAYHLLNACTQHELSPEHCSLALSGFIDEKSNLYDELYRYFLHIEIDRGDKETKISQAISQYPAHFFSPLILLAKCVS